MPVTLRILHLIHTPRHSGAEMLVYELCRVHKEWGHECAVASFEPCQSEFDKEARTLEEIGVSLYFPRDIRNRMARIGQYRDAILKFQPTVIFAHSELPSLYGRLANGLRRPHTPFISVLHALRNFESMQSMLAEKLMRYLNSSIVAVSDHVAKSYVQKFGKGVPVAVIQNGIDVQRFGQVDRSAARRRLGITTHAPLVLQVGRVYELKQQHIALIALKPWLKAGKVDLWFSGLLEDACYAERLRKLVANWNADHSVRFLGSRSDVPELLAAADLYLMPSRLESQGIALLEALASGIPIIASDIPEFAFARNMPSVRICPVGDEARWAASAEEMLNAPRAKRDIQNFSIECTAEAYLNVARDSRG